VAQVVTITRTALAAHMPPMLAVTDIISKLMAAALASPIIPNTFTIRSKG